MQTTLYRLYGMIPLSNETYDCLWPQARINSRYGSNIKLLYLHESFPVIK